jgi:hypothetical protein
MKTRTVEGKSIVRLAIMVVLAALVLLPTGAQAVILNFGYNLTPVAVGDGASHYLPITRGGSTTMSFTTTAPNQRVAVLFNTQCSVQAADHISYVDPDILIDGVAAPPSNVNTALCTSNGHNIGNSGWVSTSTNAIKTVAKAGSHTIMVRVTLRNYNSGENFRIDDTSIIVMR